MFQLKSTCNGTLTDTLNEINKKKLFSSFSLYDGDEFVLRALHLHTQHNERPRKTERTELWPSLAATNRTEVFLRGRPLIKDRSMHDSTTTRPASLPKSRVLIGQPLITCFWSPSCTKNILCAAPESWTHFSFTKPSFRPPFVAKLIPFNLFLS